jgi:hypothetical protein
MFEQPVLATEWFAWEVAKADDTTVRSMGSWARSRIPQFTLSLEGITSLPAVTFSGGEDGPAVDETLDALRSVSSAAGFVDRYRKAVKDCDAVTYSVPGVGTSTLHARAISFDDMGDDSFAGRSGALDGFEVIQVGVQSEDVVLGLSFFWTDPADAEDATSVALDKTQETLGTSTNG